MNNKNESGRSMIEILGVVAIIGVLSLIGIHGYGLAMTQYKANQVWHDVQLRAQYIRGIPNYNDGSKAGIVSFESLGVIGTSGYEIEGNIQPIDASDGAFQIIVFGVKYNVCERVIQMRPDEIVAIWPNDNWSTTCSEENNMVFIFDVPQGPCSDFLKKYYENWRKQCGKEWDWCSPSLGMFCQQYQYPDNSCIGGFGFDCNGAPYNKAEDNWFYYGDGYYACPEKML